MGGQQGEYDAHDVKETPTEISGISLAAAGVTYISSISFSFSDQVIRCLLDQFTESGEALLVFEKSHSMSLAKDEGGIIPVVASAVILVCRLPSILSRCPAHHMRVRLGDGNDAKSTIRVK